MKLKRGDKVCYVPRHADGDEKHTDCEFGEIWRVDDTTALVEFSYGIMGVNVDDLKLIS